MTAAQDATKQLEQQALGQLRALHSTIIETARRRSEQIAKAGPDARYYARMLGLPKDLAEQQQAAIDSGFAFAEKVLELQRQFALELVRLGVPAPTGLPVGRLSVATASGSRPDRRRSRARDPG